jgi:Radical SAM superfamily/4Fe-4S single cluster domain
MPEEIFSVAGSVCFTGGSRCYYLSVWGWFSGSKIESLGAVMHPKTTRTIDRREFEDLRRTVALRAEGRRAVAADAAYATPLPREVSLQLTYRCNLRCDHCFQWNDQGFFQDFSKAKQRSELDLAIVEKVLRATEEQRAKVFLWGGEPLMYTRFGELAEMLAGTERVVNVCTNALLIERNLPHLLRSVPGCSSWSASTAYATTTRRCGARAPSRALSRTCGRCSTCSGPASSGARSRCRAW